MTLQRHTNGQTCLSQHVINILKLSTISLSFFFSFFFFIVPFGTEIAPIRQMFNQTTFYTIGKNFGKLYVSKGSLYTESIDSFAKDVWIGYRVLYESKQLSIYSFVFKCFMFAIALLNTQSFCIQCSMADAQCTECRLPKCAIYSLHVYVPIFHLFAVLAYFCADEATENK